MHSSQVRTFDTGATRSDDTARDDPEGYLSPLVLERYCQYLTKHRLQPDGSTRDSDNWQKGIPLPVYMKGLLRHAFHAWSRHRGWAVADPKAGANIQEDLCAIAFNSFGYLHELLRAETAPEKTNTVPFRVVPPAERPRVVYTDEIDAGPPPGWVDYLR